jgi:hypothetical protein
MIGLVKYSWMIMTLIDSSSDKFKIFWFVNLDNGWKLIVIEISWNEFNVCKTKFD